MKKKPGKAAISRKNRHPSVLDPAHVTNWLALFSITRPFQFGSLWWVDEDIWKSFIEQYDQDSIRDHHPGLCLQTLGKVNSLSMTVPMLQGRSRCTGRHFRVYNTSPERTAPSCFQTFCPLPLGYFISKNSIFRNQYKPILNDREKNALSRYLDQTGIMS